MATDIRKQFLSDIVQREARVAEYPRDTAGNPLPPSDFFGENVFGLKEMKKALPKPVYATLVKQIKGHQRLDRPTCDAIAHAVKVWAIERGATHYTHWFQPQTDTTAEKHDCFLDYRLDGEGAVIPMDTFSGGQLLQSEPDASSFPSGGMRSTFEARGYTIWDCKSPMFIRKGPSGTATLCIPSVFIGYNGEALDEKTILLRSTQALSTAATTLLHLIGDKDVENVVSTLGCEQEYFLIDRALYSLRTDLKFTGRTLMGAVLPRLQEVDAHYFGKIPSKVLAFMSEMELECFKLGVPIKTRHNEVAPSQFEAAPIFEEASIAVDHNLLTMEIIHKIAHLHKFKAIFHEKPFKGINGSGKHCNWSMATDTGINLLEPTKTPETNYRFLLFLVATLYGVHKHAGLLRASIASASNDHRLGAHEAPPAIISAFLGEQLTEVLNSIEEGRPVADFSKPHLTNVSVGGTMLDVQVATLPEIHRDLTDRNRTSPFAFTGNKFEFRAVGGKQSPSFPVSMVNACAVAGIKAVTAALEAKKGAKAVPSTEDILAVVKDFVVQTKAIRFEGNGYSQEWRDEAARRGLPNLPNTAQAIKMLLEPQNAALLTSLGIYSEQELQGRYHVLAERYVKDLMIEASTLKVMVRQQILPAVYEYRKHLAETLVSIKTVSPDLLADAPEQKVLAALQKAVLEVIKEQDALEAIFAQVKAIEDNGQQADLIAAKLKPQLAAVRSASDKLEELVGEKYWPFPRYTELLFN